MSIILPKNRAIKLLDTSKSVLNKLSREDHAHRSVAYQVWQRDTSVRIEEIFGDSPHCTYFANATDQDDWYREKTDVTALLESMINEVNEFGDDDIVSDEPSTSTVRQDSRKVFVVHGKDEAVKQEVARFLTKLKLEPIVLSEQVGRGLTIIEKFEAHSKVGFAVVLLTPDDIGIGYRDEEPRPRARQNVIFEFGYFLGKLGRGNVHLLLIKEDLLESLSNYAGVEYTKFDDNGGWKLKLAQELKAGGLNVDMNLLSGSS